MMGRYKSALFQVSDRQQPQETEMVKISLRHIYYEVVLQQEWCWPPLQWRGVHMVPQSKLPSRAGDSMRCKGGRAGISLFNCTIGSSLLIAVSGEIRETRSGHLGIYKSSCVIQTPVPRRADTKSQARSYMGSVFLSTTDRLWVFFIQNKRKRQHSTGKTVSEASRS